MMAERIKTHWFPYLCFMVCVIALAAGLLAPHIKVLPNDFRGYTDANASTPALQIAAFESAWNMSATAYTATANGNWSAATTWDVGTTTPTSGDTALTTTNAVVLDVNPLTVTTMSASATGVYTLTASADQVITGNVTYGGAATTGMIAFNGSTTGRSLLINGQLTNLSTGYAVVGSGTAKLTILNAAGTAVTGAAGRAISFSATNGPEGTARLIITGAMTAYGTVSQDMIYLTGTPKVVTTGTINNTNTTNSTYCEALNIQGSVNWTHTGDILYNGGAANFGKTVQIDYSPVCTITGTITSNICYLNLYGFPLYMNGGTVTFTGSLSSTNNAIDIWVNSGSLYWTGASTLAANTDAHIYNAAGNLYLTGLTLSNSGNFIIHKRSGTITYGTCKINQQTSSATAAIIGDAGNFANVIVGPTLPAAAQTVYTGAATYGYPSALYDGTYYGPNLDSAPGVVTPAAVVTTAHYGISNTTTGTATGGGYTYGDSDAAKVLTTAVGAGSYVVPVQAGYSALAAGYGDKGATAGTLAASKIHDGTYGTLADGSVLVAAGGTYVDPADSAVWHGVSVGVSPRVGTKVGSSITNLTATHVASGWAIDDVTGTFTGTAGYVLITDVVAAQYVWSGTANYVGGSTGTLTLPLNGSWVSTATGAFGVAGTSITPSLTLPLNGSWVSTATSAFGIGGSSVTPSLDLTLYTLKTNVASAIYVWSGTANYGGGTTGTLTLPDGGYVLTSTAAYGVGGSGSTPTATLPTNGTWVLTSTGPFGVNSNSITPSATIPTGSYVYSGTAAYGIGGTSQTPTLTLTTGAYVFTGTAAFGVSGSSVTPALTLTTSGNVRSTVTFGVGGNSVTGTLTLPAVGNVKGGVQFGAGGVEYTGSFRPPIIPTGGN